METCRFCLEEADPTTLLDPCLCRGSVRYVHPDCLDMELNARARAGTSTKDCRICGSTYVLQPTHQLFMLYAVIPTYITYITAYVQPPVLLALLYILAMMNWTLCMCWTLTPTPCILRRRLIRGVLACGLLTPFASTYPITAIVVSFTLPYATFVSWISEEISPRRLLFGLFALSEVFLLTGALTQQVEACLLLGTLSVLPLSALMLTV